MRRIPFSGLHGWSFADGSGNLRHATGRFFSVTGMHSSAYPGGTPVLVQPETGVLGLLLKEFDGLPHALMQAKFEPGNLAGPQLSPTVQATHSNYTRVHGGSAVPYLDHFLAPGAGDEVLADGPQSEQGHWFWRKHNRNIVVRTRADVPVRDRFRWVPLPLLHGLLCERHLVNMDSRSVLACLPPPYDVQGRRPYGSENPAPYRLDGLHSLPAIRAWLARQPAAPGRLVPLRSLTAWRVTDDALTGPGPHRIIAVDVRAEGREVSAWTQPLLAPARPGFAAFALRRFDSVPHLLVAAVRQPGFARAELGATVQEGATGGPYVRILRAALGSRVLYDGELSEEGGRFHRALTRYRLVEVPDAHAPEGHLWVTPHQLGQLVRGGAGVTVEARTLLACLRGVDLRRTDPRAAGSARSVPPPTASAPAPTTTSPPAGHDPPTPLPPPDDQDPEHRP